MTIVTERCLQYLDEEVAVPRPVLEVPRRTCAARIRCKSGVNQVQIKSGVNQT